MKNLRTDFVDDQKTYVLPFSEQTFLSELHRKTKPYGEKPRRRKDFQRYAFTGKIDNNHFKISRTILEPNNFLAIAEGSVESTSKGCILMIRYKSFKFTRVLMIFFALLGLLVGTFFSVIEPNYLYASLIFMATIIHTLVCVLSFRRQRKLLQHLLEEIIESCAQKAI